MEHRILVQTHVIHLLVAGITFWVAIATFTINCAPTPLPLTASHGLYDNITTVVGWPLVFSKGSQHNPHVAPVPGSPRGAARIQRTDWFSAHALVFDSVVALVVTAATAGVCAKVGERVRAKRYSLTDLGMTVLATCVGVWILVKGDSPDDLARLLGADLNGPRLATFAWFPRWIQLGISIGASCAVVIFAHACATLAATSVRRCSACVKARVL